MSSTKSNKKGWVKPSFCTYVRNGNSCLANNYHHGIHRAVKEADSYICTIWDANIPYRSLQKVCIIKNKN